MTTVASLRLDVPAELVASVRLDLSADGTHVIATYRDGAIEHGVVDGRRLPPARWEPGRPPPTDWSADRTRRAMVAREAGRARLCVSDAAGDVWGEAYDDLRLFRGGFRDGIGTLVFAYLRGGRWWIVREGAPLLGPFDDVLSLAWKGPGLVGVVREGHAHRVFFSWREASESLACSPRPAIHVAHGAVAIVDGPPGAFVVHHLVEGEVPALYGPFAMCPRVALGADGSLVLAIVHTRSDTEIRLVTSPKLLSTREAGPSPRETRLGDGTTIARVSAVRSLDRATGPSGRRLAFAYDQGGFAGFYADGVRREGLGYSDGPWWSDDGAHLLWAAERARDDGTSEAFAVLDGAEHVLPHAIDWEQGSSVRVTARAEVCLFGLDRAHDTHWVHLGAKSFGPFSSALEDGARRERYERVAFSADGARVAFQRAEGEHAWVHLDDEVLGPLPRPCVHTLLADGTLVVASLARSGELTVLRRA
ncbi:MAG: hypothetical protein K1X94_11670 [Sandaracinaceae bacterium]|nr:hypothetical protein [Sandaracinaceae bacterium]